jgi:hypothetical protein
MGDVEHAIKPTLAPMIRGQKVLLGPQDQITIASWSSKTAIALEFFEPRMAVTTEDDRRLLSSQLRPPHHHRVCLARADVYKSLMVKTLVGQIQ